MKKYLAAIIGVIILFGLDQWSKILIYNNLSDGRVIPVIGDAFVLEYLENRGAAFGVLQNRQFLLIIVSLLILLVLTIAYIKLPPSPKFHILRFLSVMLIAGAAGNMCDRIFRGYVVDFLYFKWIDFPVFNIADCYVVVSAVSIAILMMFYYKEEDYHIDNKQSKTDKKDTPPRQDSQR